MAWGPSPAALVPSFYSPAAVRVNPVVSEESTCCAINLLLTHFAASSVAKLTHLPVGSLCLVTLLEIARLISARRRGGTKLDPWRHNTNPSAALGHFRLSLLLVTGGSCGSTQLRTAAVAALANTSCSLLQPSRHVQLLQTQLLVKLLSGGSHCSAR